MCQILLGNPNIKSDSSCDGFSKGMKNMSFHGLVDHVKYYFIIELPIILKYDPSILLKDN
jgi:hypothetical protein